MFWGAWTQSSPPQPYNMPGSKAFANTFRCSVFCVLLWTSLRLLSLESLEYCQLTNLLWMFSFGCFPSDVFLRRFTFRSLLLDICLCVEHTIQLFTYFVNRYYCLTSNRSLIIITSIGALLWKSFSGYGKICITLLKPVHIPTVFSGRPDRCRINRTWWK